MSSEPKGVMSGVSAGNIDAASTSEGVGKVESHALAGQGGSDDVAAKYANYFENEETWSSKEWWRLRWKLHARLVPILRFNVTLGAMDKVTTGRAALYGFIEDTNLTGDRYSWVGSAFYVSHQSKRPFKRR